MRHQPGQQLPLDLRLEVEALDRHEDFAQRMGPHHERLELHAQPAGGLDSLQGSAELTRLGELS